jgi:GWxTD domain-containing protein
MKTKIIVLVGLSALFFHLFLTGQQKSAEDALPQKYRDWLNLTSYIILPEEREVFQKLSSDRERDIFIEAFWKQRDPTPGTPQNEYKEEIISRFLAANRQFGRGTTREGWMTDMGKITILLGPPVSRERWVEIRGIYPCEAWYYYGDPKKGLPTYFGLLFFQKGAVGEFKLYHPISDGPASLLVDGQNMNSGDYQALYQKIKELAPAIAPLVLSPIPGEVPEGFQPSLRADLILADIINSPRKDVSPSYATHFLNYRGMVSTEYLTNYVDIGGLAEVIPDPHLGIRFVHFSLSPKSVSVDFYQPKNQYYCNYSLDVSLRDGGRIIYQYSKEFPFYYSPEDDPVVRAGGICLQDSFPVIEGNFKLVILVRNSVSKEFSVYEKDIAVEKGASPRILGPWLGYKLEETAVDIQAPFKVNDKRLCVDPKNTFTRADQIAVAFAADNVPKELGDAGSIKITIQGLEGAQPIEKVYNLPLAGRVSQSLLVIDHSFPAAELAPNYYEMSVSLIGKDTAPVAETRTNFIISAAASLPRPVVIAKTFPLANAFLYFYMIADQYDKAGQLEKAEASYEKAYSLAPDYHEGLVYFSNFLIKVKKPARALELEEGLKGEEKFLFDYYFIKGRAHLGLGQYDQAIVSLLAGNAIYDSDTNLLNTLGFCFYKVGKKDEAKKAFEASLRLNPEQPEVRKLLEEVRK